METNTPVAYPGYAPTGGPAAADPHLDSWLAPPPTAPGAATPSDSGLQGTRQPRRIAAAVGLLAVGALAGALGASALRGTNSSAAGGLGNGGFAGPGATTAQSGTLPDATTTTGMQVVGTITAITSTSITVNNGTSAVAYKITSATVVRQGTAAVALGTLKAGQSVTLAVTGTGTAATVQTITVGAATGTPPTGTGTPPTGAGGPPAA